MPDKDINYVGKFETETFDVTFDVQGHGTAPATQSISYGSKVNKVTPPSAAGYKFIGWYKEATCENIWDFDNDTVEGPTTIYAKWTEVKEFSSASWEFISTQAGYLESGIGPWGGSYTTTDFCNAFTINSVTPTSMDDFIGQTKSISVTVDTEALTHSVRVIGTQHDTLADSSTTAALTFEFGTLLSQYSGEHIGLGVKHTWMGGAEYPYAWETCGLRTYLNGVVINYLPNDLKNVLKTVKKETYDINSDQNKEYDETVFILSAKEMGYTGSEYAKDGSPYKYYEDCTSLEAQKRQKKDWYKDMSDYTYWTRSTYADNSSTGDLKAWYVETSGTLAYSSKDKGYALMLAPAFCI